MGDANLLSCDPETGKTLVLAEIAQAIATKRSLKDVNQSLAQALRRITRFDRLSLILADVERDRAWVYLSEGDIPGIDRAAHEYQLSRGPAGEVYRTRKPLIVRDAQLETRWPELIATIRGLPIRSTMSLPLFVAQRFLGTLTLLSSEVGAYEGADLTFLEPIASVVAVAVDNALNFEKLTELKNKLAEEKHYLEEELRTEGRFRKIIGQSQALRQVLDQVRTVAPTNAAVLILGETGTGKELVARAIHEMSGRKDRAFVKLNCAAIPTGLLESDLFGHEKGAFTGAVAQKHGRYELAHEGTLFLDEVGDIPLELQPKLLRVLQEQEFERLGGTKTLKVDVRLLAATNQELDRLVLEKKFRSDFFYRLNVFPIRVPPLRERRKDIPLLVRYFVETMSRKLKKDIKTIPAATMEAFCHYGWPGNIRELENFVERSAILSKGNDLTAPLSELGSAEGRPAAPLKGENVLERGERDALVRALRASGWIVSGPSGAAAKLGIDRSTLQYKMRKFNLNRPS